jgi:hypothetical protein
MSFRATTDLPAVGLRRAKQLASQFKVYLQARRPLFVAGTTADTVLATYFDSVRFRDSLTAIAAIPGIAAYAQAQENDGSYDVVSEFTALIADVDAMTAEISSTFPADGSGYLLDRQLAPDGKSLVYRDFTGPQLATLVTLVDAVLAAIV